MRHILDINKKINISENKLFFCPSKLKVNLMHLKSFKLLPLK